VMKNNNFTYETPEKQDEFIQSLSISDIKTNLTGKSVLKTKPKTDEPNEYIEMDFELQNLSISELKQLQEQENFNASMQYKIIQTGLDENTILLIETNKYRASLAELISYCRGLNISYRKFLPELFNSEDV